MKCMKPGNARRQGCGYESSTSARRATPFQLGPAWAGSGESDTNEEKLPPTTHTHTTCLLGARLRGTQSSPRLPKAQKRLSASACHSGKKGALRRLALQRCLIADRLMLLPSEPLLTFVEYNSNHLPLEICSICVCLLLHKVCVCSFLHCMH